MRRFPAELSELLSPRGRRLLQGKSPLYGALYNQPFVADEGLLDPRASRATLVLLERTMRDVLTLMEDPIPEEALTGMRENYSERLPKTVRARTALLESRRAKAYRAAVACGLVQMLRSPSFHAFATALSGRRLKKGHGIQTLCYAPGDYTGPHNDHHPEEPDARGGYIDVHLTFSTRGVRDQLLIYERDGHFSECRSVATVGGVTAYRLPFWHYTTPLVAKPKQEQDARRWVLLGTFLFAD
ncbi:MAG: hypothetical protein ACT4TC_23350 [Myxococcaceae bacterium]